MSVILGQRPLAMGLDAATSAIRRSQDRFATAAAEVARQGAATSATPSPAKITANASLPAQTPPNPGPPGGAHPADLAQAMVDAKLSVRDLAANVKTVQAFDQMLEELSRPARSGAEPSG